MSVQQTKTHNLREPCQGGEESWRGFSLTIDGVEDKHKMPALGLDGLPEHPGQLEVQLRQALTPRGEFLEA